MGNLTIVRYIRKHVKDVLWCSVFLIYIFEC